VRTSSLTTDHRKGRHDAVDAIESAGGSAVAARADVSNRAEVEHMVEICHEAFGPADVLVNNAGITADKQFTEMSRASGTASWTLTSAACSTVPNCSTTISGTPRRAD